MISASFVILIAIAAGPFALMYFIARQRPTLVPVRIKPWRHRIRRMGR